jgi:hypothetical protein
MRDEVQKQQAKTARLNGDITGEVNKEPLMSSADV